MTDARAPAALLLPLNPDSSDFELRGDSAFGALDLDEEGLTLMAYLVRRRPDTLGKGEWIVGRPTVATAVVLPERLGIDVGFLEDTVSDGPKCLVFRDPIPVNVRVEQLLQGVDIIFISAVIGQVGGQLLVEGLRFFAKGSH